MPRIAYFAAAYWGARAEPRTITVEPTWTMLPCPCFSIRSPNSWVMSSVPLTSMSMTASSASWVSSSQFICSLETSPTLLTSTSSVPNAAQTSSAMRLISAHEPMSAWTRMPSLPASRMRSSVASAPAFDER